MSAGLDKLVIPVRGGGELVLTVSSSRVDFGQGDCGAEGLPKDWLGRTEAGKPLASLEVKNGLKGPLVRVVETRRYCWKLIAVAGGEVSSSLETGKAEHWSVSGGIAGDESGNFQVVNQLGRAWLVVRRKGEEVLRLELEVISAKLDFDEEYRRMTEDVAGFCEQLLLQWSGATSLRFGSHAQEERKLLLEQYLFLKGFLTEERMGVLCEAIERNPHRELVKEREWKPASLARSQDFMMNPMGMMRDWRRRGGRAFAGEVLDVRKEESWDTEPNRFVKAALEEFRRICAEVAELHAEKDSLVAEAQELGALVERLLGRRFFREVGRMRRLPLDNQALQKREGYREVLRGWILTQAAVSLNWEGNEECFEGTTKRVDVLYEYWIFIQLHELLKNRVEGLVILEGDEEGDFVREKEGEIEIHLKRGQKSRARFVWKEKLAIDLFYERTFSQAGVGVAGSYSRRFRPDYTLTIYPFGMEEMAAQKVGKVAHLHLDAKYRVEQVKGLFGGADDEDAKDEEKALGVYKRGDLLKMHTYNDALRNSIGSYVLYPGTGEEGEKMPKFNEVAPGVGAFVMKPGNEAALGALASFFREVLEHQADRFTQYRYLADTEHETVKADSKVKHAASRYRVARKDAECVLLWANDERQLVFREKGFAYCWAVPENENRELALDLSLEVGSEFIPYGGGPGNKKGWGWRAKVEKVKFLAKEELNKTLQPHGLRAGRAKFYLFFELGDLSEIDELKLEGVVPRGGDKQYMAQRCSWGEILRAQVRDR